MSSIPKFSSRKSVALPRALFGYGILLDAILFLITFFISLALFEVYYAGDQFYYTDFYYTARDTSFSNIAWLQLQTTGSAEPFFGIMVWLASAVFEKSTFMSLANGAGVIVLRRVVLRLGASPLLFPLVLSNYYLMVVLIPAERLKFALIFLGIAYLSKGVWRYAAMGVALLFHFQTLAFISVLASRTLYYSLRDLAIHRGRKFYFSIATNVFILVSLALAFFFVMNSYQFQIQAKLGRYQENEISEILRSLIFLCAALWLARDRIEVVFVFAPLLVLAFSLGGERVNMVSFLFLCGYMLSYKRGLNFTSATLLLYFVWKNVDFTVTFIEHGTGWI